MLGTRQFLRSVEHNTGTYFLHNTAKGDSCVFIVVTAIFFSLERVKVLAYIRKKLVKMFQQSRLPAVVHLRWHAIATRCFAAPGTTRHNHSWLSVELPHDWQSPDTIQGYFCDNSLSGIKLNIVFGRICLLLSVRISP